MKTPRIVMVVSLLLVVLVAGCVTPESRIKGNPAAFDRLTPEQQQLVREGRVGIGFDRDAVKLALGEPDRVWRRTDQSGESESWIYTAYETDRGVPLYRGYWHRYYCPTPLAYPYYQGFAGRKEREVFKVMFEKDVVTSVESEA